jgi:hypothetical protein
MDFLINKMDQSSGALWYDHFDATEQLKEEQGCMYQQT